MFHAFIDTSSAWPLATNRGARHMPPQPGAQHHWCGCSTAMYRSQPHHALVALPACVHAHVVGPLQWPHTRLMPSAPSTNLYRNTSYIEVLRVRSGYLPGALASTALRCQHCSALQPPASVCLCGPPGLCTCNTTHCKRAAACPTSACPKNVCSASTASPSHPRSPALQCSTRHSCPHVHLTRTRVAAILRVPHQRTTPAHHQRTTSVPHQRIPYTAPCCLCGSVVSYRSSRCCLQLRLSM